MIQLQAQDFNDAIARAKKFTGPRFLPILQQIKLETKDGNLTIQSTDLENFYSETIPGTPGSDFSTMIFPKIPKYKGLIQVSVPDQFRTQINQDVFGVMDYQDFPCLPCPDTTNAELTTLDTFRDLITKALTCTIRDESRHNLDTVHLRGSCSRLESTDGNRVNVSACSFIPQEIDVCVPEKGLRLALAVLPKKGSLLILYSEKQITLTWTGNERSITVMIRLKDPDDGTFPDIDKIFNNAMPDIPVWVNKADLEKGLRLAKIMTSDRNPGVTFTFLQDGMKLTSSLVDVGNCEHKITSYTPEYLLNTEIILNVELMIPAVKLWDQENVPLYISSHETMALVGNQGIMPMRK